RQAPSAEGTAHLGVSWGRHPTRAPLGVEAVSDGSPLDSRAPGVRSFRVMADSTELYLIRHGLAGEAGPAGDELRPLTAVGQKRTRAVAKRLQMLHVHFDLLLSSPLLRARQTAALLERAGLCEHVEESTLLAPGGDFQQWLGWLARWRRRGSHRRL